MLKCVLRGVAQAWVIFGITLLLLLLVDHLLRALPGAELARFDPDGPSAPKRESAAAVQGDQRWIDDYWRDHHDARRSEWHSYVYWRRAQFAGSAVNVDAHGFRVTPPSVEAEQRTLWLFGGSTAWGTGNRDGGTLAAQLERLYAQNAPELGVRVRNFGESGYVSQQSALAFQLALRCPEPPADLAVFLDGPNDVFATVQSGRAGEPQNESNRRREFNASNHLRELLGVLAVRFEGIARLARRAPAVPTDAELGTQAEQTATAYLASLRQTRALAAAAGVDTLHLWQPTVFDRSTPVADESAIVGASPATHVRLQRTTRKHLQAALAADPALGVVDLGGVFDDHPAPVFFDFVHLSEAGQLVLAERVYRLSVEKMNARVPHGPRIDRCPARPLG